jgi:hypothetical protein
MNKKIFILCMGAQKAGTTILYDVLEKNNYAKFGNHKEKNIFSGNHPPINNNFLINFKQLINNIKLVYKILISRKKFIDKIVKLSMRFIPYFYEFYFYSLTRKNNLTGDFSPKYSILKSNQLEKIIKKFKLFNIETKIIFLIRDPVERCLSMVKMQKHNNMMKILGIKNDINLIEHLKLIYPSKKCQNKTRYEKTIKNIKQIQIQTDYLILINEKLNSVSTIKKINSFLKINLARNSFQEKKFSNNEKINIPNNLYKKIVLFYKETYFYCFYHYPKTKTVWSKAFNLLKKEYPHMSIFN